MLLFLFKKADKYVFCCLKYSLSFLALFPHLYQLRIVRYEPQSQTSVS